MFEIHRHKMKIETIHGEFNEFKINSLVERIHKRQMECENGKKHKKEYKNREARAKEIGTA